MTNTSHQYYGPLSSLAGSFGTTLPAFGVGARTASGGTTGFAGITLGVIAALVGTVPPAVTAEGVGNNPEGDSGMLLLTFFCSFAFAFLVAFTPLFFFFCFFTLSACEFRNVRAFAFSGSDCRAAAGADGLLFFERTFRCGCGRL